MYGSGARHWRNVWFHKIWSFGFLVCQQKTTSSSFLLELGDRCKKYI